MGEKKKISAARAHVLMQETLAAEAPGEEFTGRVTEQPEFEYPQNLHFEVECSAPEGVIPSSRKLGSSWKISDDKDEITEDEVADGVKRVVAACRRMHIDLSDTIAKQGSVTMDGEGTIRVAPQLD